MPRLQALKKAKIESIDIPVRQLSDTAMMKMMAHENQREWHHSASVALETIRAIVNGFAAGKIELPKAANADHGSLRYAPSFIGTGKSSSGRPELLYSAATIASFLGGDKAGWSRDKIELILGILSAIEEDLIDEADVSHPSLSIHQAEQIARQARRVAKETGDTTVSKKVGKGMSNASGL